MTDNIFSRSILGGISIMIASYIHLNVGGIYGAILFSIGLLIILNMNLKLFTGTVGYIEANNYHRTNTLILTGNVIGCTTAMLFQNQIAQELMDRKLSLPFETTFTNSIVCGILIYAAVDCFRMKKDYMVPLCVTGFITFGAEHCIADLCYALMSYEMSVKIILFLIVVAFGNGIGAIMMHLGTRRV